MKIEIEKYRVKEGDVTVINEDYVKSYDNSSAI